MHQGYETQSASAPVFVRSGPRLLPSREAVALMAAGPINCRLWLIATLRRNPHCGVAVERRSASSRRILRDDHCGPPADASIYACVETALAKGPRRIIESHADYVWNRDLLIDRLVLLAANNQHGRERRSPTRKPPIHRGLILLH